MEIIVIYLIIAIALFIAAFITKRRFGLLGLALAAGSILSGIWGYDAGLVASLVGVPSNAYTTAALSVLIILLPAVILLFHGTKYKNLIGRIVGATLFTLLATAFLIEPLSHIMMPQGFGVEVFKWLTDNQKMIIGFGLILAVVDLFLTKPIHLLGKHHKH